MTYATTTTQAPKTINLSLEGYWTNAAGTPTGGGIYCVYSCTYNAVKNEVSIRSLIYVGESGGVRARIAEHLGDETGRAWKRHLKPGEVLCYSYAPITLDRERAEAALIYKHKPPTNTQCVHNFPYPRTRIVSNGSNAKLVPDFTVG